MITAEGNIRGTLETITPEVAEDMMGHNLNNRNLREGIVYRTAEAIERGEWEVNGDTIKFDRDGVLLDGQHRLAACVLCGIPIKTWVIRGLEGKARDSVDTGISRSNGDILGLSGYTAASHLAACLRWIYLIRKDLMKSARSYRNNITPTLGKQMIAESPSIPEDLKFTYILQKNVPFPHPLAGAMYHEFSRRDQAQANEFFLRFANGDSLQMGNPILVLRNKMFREYAKPQRLPSNYFGAFMVKAWNAWREGREIHLLTWNPGGSMNEKFPEIR